MDNLERNKLTNNYIWTLIGLSLVMIGILFYYHWMIGVTFTLLLLIIFYYVKQEEKRTLEDIYHYLENISFQTDEAGKEVFFHLPIGIIAFDENHKVKWANPYMVGLNDDQMLFGQSMAIYGDDIVDKLIEEKGNFWITLGQLHLYVKADYEHRILYLFNRTDEVELEEIYHNEKLVLAHIYLDNYEEISGNMSDNVKSHLNSEITSSLNKWADMYQFYLKRTSQDRFLAIFTQETLAKLETSNFIILDELRNLDIAEVQRNPITLSIGVGTGNVTIPELAKLAQSSLDLALGRGGDQVAIREEETGNVRFYGGKTNPMEKRTRVRARVISHALKELVKDSDNVIIMGHKSPDMDSLGSAIGVLNIAQSNGVEGYIVHNQKDVLTGVERVLNHIKEEESLWKYFIGPEEAEAVITSRSLVVVVDTHRPGLTAHEKLLRDANYKVVIDHHRRGEDFIENPTLVYMEPYASSTSELVTELIEYQPHKKVLSTLEATSLLSGIIVDTQSFALRTGSRTFDAASYLRSKGADPVLIQEFLKEDLNTVIKRNRLIGRANIVWDKIAISTAEEDEIYNHITIAQAADSLLAIEHVKASFVIANKEDNVVSISARSLGEINVQVIMEALEGGGHLTNAATQLSDITPETAERFLIEKLTHYFEGGE